MNKILVVALDLTEHDPTLIQYAKDFQNKYSIEKVHFIHNIKVSELDELIAEMMEDIEIKPIIQRSLENRIKSIFADSNLYSLTLLEGDNTEFGINEWVKKLKEPTSIVIGWKTTDNGTGAMSHKLLRLTQADVYLVPKGSTFKAARILVPSDFSSSISRVKKKVEGLNPDNVQVLKVYNIPSVFFPFIDDKATQAKAEKLASQQFSELRKKLTIPSEWTMKTKYQQERSVADIIVRECKVYQADLIALAAKGSNNIASIFLGSTTNELINKEPTQCPLYIIK